LLAEIFNLRETFNYSLSVKPNRGVAAVFRFQLLPIRLGSILGAVCLLAVSQADAQRPQVRAPLASDGTLQWRFEKDQALSMVSDQTTRISISVAGQMITSENQNLNEMTMRILDVNEEGTATISVTIDRMKMDIDANGQRMQLDTSSQEEAAGEAVGPMAEVAQMVQPMIGKAISQKMAPSGKIFDVNVPEDMLPQDQSNPLAAALMSKKNLEEMTSRASLEFPKPDLEMGFSWQVKAELEMGPATVETTTDYTYLGVKEGKDGPVHVIEGKIQLRFPQGVAGNNVEIVNEDSTSLFYFDGVQGRLRGSELFQDMTMRINNAGQVAEQQIAQTMKTTVELLKESENPQ
jgi:hypothetical protein